VDVSGAVSSTIPIGTHGYAPAEQVRGRPRLSSDIYAVGMTAIQALTGIDNPDKLPEDNNGEVIWRDRTQVSDWLADILIKMVRSDFRQRYQSAAEALQALQTLVSIELKPFICGNDWGYKNEIGKVIIPPQFQDAGNFSDGLARVRLGYHWGYINETGTKVIPPLFGWVGDFSEGLARVVVGSGKLVYINKEGECVSQYPFDGGLDFSEGLAAVMIDKKWGYVGKNGQGVDVVIEPKFDDAENFSNGRARVRIDWQWRYIDKAGKFIDS
jgi:serine/threonine-protein kinase